MASSQAQVAKACKKFITGLGIKCSAKSESFAGGNSVHVEYHDVSPTVNKQISKELSKYQYGHFDGMTDSYEYSNSRDDIPQTKYLSLNNRFTAEMKQRAWNFICGRYVTTNLSNIYAEVDTHAQVRGMWADQFMWQFLNGSIDADVSEEFWSTQSAPKAKKNATPKAKYKPVDAVTISAGTRDGYSEVRFPEKPDSEARAILKEAGFRWSPRNGCWWGKTDNLPETYQG